MATYTRVKLTLVERFMAFFGFIPVQEKETSTLGGAWHKQMPRDEYNTLSGQIMSETLPVSAPAEVDRVPEKVSFFAGLGKKKAESNLEEL